MKDVWTDPQGWLVGFKEGSGFAYRWDAYVKGWVRFPKYDLA